MEAMQLQCVSVVPAATAGAKHVHAQQNNALQKHNARVRSYASDAIGVCVYGPSTNLLHQLCWTCLCLVESRPTAPQDEDGMQEM